jgi:hypothetical protein
VYKQSQEKSARLKKANQEIKNAWVAGTFCSTATLILTLLSVFGVNIVPGVDLSALLDVGLGCGLSFGVYKKNRACAVILFTYFVANKIYIWSQTNTLQGLYLAVILGVCFFQGITGTFSYHKLTKK